MGKEIPNFYAVEGLDGAGKSSVISELKNMGVRTIATPPEVLKKYRHIFENTDLRIRFLYYLMGVKMAGKQAEDYKGKELVISDRFLLTTLSAHEAMGISKKWISLWTPLINSVARPEKTFIVVCDEEERLRRLFSRGANQVDMNNLKINDQILNGYRDWSKKLGYTMEELNTTNITPLEGANHIANFKNKR